MKNPVDSVSSLGQGAGSARPARFLRRGACGLMLALLASGSAWGLVTGVAPQPGLFPVPLGQPLTVNLTWVVTSSPVPAPTYTVSSTSGVFTIIKGGAPIATVNTFLSASVSVPVGTNTGTATIAETLYVPPEVSVQANRLGSTTVLYTRTFTDGGAAGGALAGNATLLIGGSGLSRFGISRIALSFDDGAVVRVVEAKSRLGAAAEVSYVGSGALHGFWEIADPGSTSGSPVFRPLQPIGQGLGGMERATLRSPELPTEIEGLYMVRLRVTEPLPGFDPPLLYYYVGEPRPGTPLALMPMTVMSPASGSYLDRATRFSWQPVKGARAYKIEIFADPEPGAAGLPDIGGEPRGIDPQALRRALARPPVSGMLLAPSQNQTVLSTSTRAKLKAGRAYFWRVQAIGKDGAVIGAAQVMDFRTP